MIHSVPAGDGGFCPAVGYLSVEQAYFSDTFVVWTDYDSFRIPAFFEMCSELFCYSLELGIPIRGGVAVGDAHMDKEKNIFLGPSLIDAYLAESAGQWLGISCGNSFSAEQYRGPFDPRTILPYSKHQNPDKKYKLDGLVLDWPRLWRTTGRPDVHEKLRLMDTEPEFHKYYSNAIAFVEESADKHNWWELQNSIMRENNEENRIKPVFWVGSSVQDLKTFPSEVQREIGYALYQAQIGEKHHKTKTLKGFSGVMEIRSDYATDTYRAVYATKIGNKIYVLHCFQKKSKRGISTPKKEIDLIRRRLREAQELARRG